MRWTGWLVGVAVVTLGGCGRADQDSDVTVTQAPNVELVGRGVVSTELPEFATAVTPRGDTIFFNRTSPDRSQLRLFISTRTGGAWNEAHEFVPTMGMTAIDPFLSPDGQRLYFSSDLPRRRAVSSSFNIWYLERTAAGWSEPIDVGAPINSDSSDVFNSLTSDGMMVFSSRRSGLRRVYSTSWVNGEWTTPVIVDLGDKESQSNPAVSADGSMLVFAASNDDERPDLFVSCRAGDLWATPQRLPEPINSPFTDFAPSIAGAFLYFTSERPGIVGAQPDSVRPPGDIYRTPLSGAARACQP